MIKQLQDALSKILLGKEEVIRLGITCLLANGHLLLEDIPGMGKTTFSHALAHLTGMKYRRIQFTSDLLPSDLIGVSIFNATDQRFEFHHGPIFSQLILADELNRASPRTQSALLEAMEERQITTDVKTEHLPRPFFVIATQNPFYHAGTYLLPESQLDRFLMRLSIGYPSEEAEKRLLSEYKPQRYDELEPIINPDILLQWQQETEKVAVGEPVIDYIQKILAKSREGGYTHGLSPRAGLGLVAAAKAFARTEERDFVRCEDIQKILPAVINHRLQMRQSEFSGTPAEQMLRSIEVPL